jgi:hypothetical protein
MFFHRGFFYEKPVAIHEITPEGERDIPFDPDAFDTLLDSPNAAGAYRAASRRDYGPGRRRRLFFRKAVRWPSSPACSRSGPTSAPRARTAACRGAWVHPECEDVSY